MAISPQQKEQNIAHIIEFLGLVKLFCALSLCASWLVRRSQCEVSAISCWRHPRRTRWVGYTLVPLGSLRLCGNVQPQARGMDRLFRLFREDQLMCIRQALEDCDSHHPNGPRPLVITNVRPEGFEFDRGHAPFFKLGFDVPEKVRRQKDLVSSICFHWIRMSPQAHCNH